jgi:hypothetical protein
MSGVGAAGVLIPAALLFLGIGCSDGSSSKAMDKSTAAAEIKTHLQGAGNTLLLLIGRLGTNCVELDSAGRETKRDLDPTTNINTIVAQRAGYATVTPDGKGFWKVALTDQGNAALAAENGKPYASKAGNGCDYQQVDFVVATPELVSVTDVTADMNAPEADYLWKWNVSELGKMLRRDGKVFSTLTPLQQAELQTHIHGLVQFLPMPVPAEDFIGSSKVTFQRMIDGWRIQ